MMWVGGQRGIDLIGRVASARMLRATHHTDSRDFRAHELFFFTSPSSKARSNFPALVNSRPAAHPTHHLPSQPQLPPSMGS